jgi:amidohydrolase
VSRVRIARLVDEVLPEIRAVRRAIHSNPELACREHDTAALLRGRLARAGVKVQAPFLGTDVVGFVRGRRKGPNVTLRADIDALPLHEETGLPHASKIPGVMHACGHDGHTAMLLGAALVMARLDDSLRGSVRFVFQPGEEVVAAGRDLVAAGCQPHPGCLTHRGAPAQHPG